MSKVFFIADTHFDHDTILRYENRPFEDVSAMNEAMIARWNGAVSPADTVYVIGDFGGDGREADILARLNGTKHLVKGNHDTRPGDYYRAAGFQEVYDLPVVYGGFWLLSHEPMYVNTNMPYANLFGHVHASPLYKDFSPQHFCVCAERVDYTPISLEEILARIAP